MAVPHERNSRCYRISISMGSRLLSYDQHSMQELQDRCKDVFAILRLRAIHGDE